MDKQLKRAVWMNREQRKMLKEAAMKAALHAKADQDLCASIVNELARSRHLSPRRSHLVHLTVLWLRMPPDMRPVQLCELEIDQIILYGKPEESLKHFLRPPRRRRNQDPEAQ